MKYLMTGIKYIIKIISVLVVLSIIGLVIHEIAITTPTMVWVDMGIAFLLGCGAGVGVWVCVWAWSE